jgi:8-oxo-dGTP pyrophosphatase MutT (NUDIX family)
MGTVLMLRRAPEAPAQTFEPSPQFCGTTEPARMILRVVEKAFGYVTWDKRLLVFDHVAFPEAGTQVPAGSVDRGETPAEAALREVREETGLAEFSKTVYLGISEFDARPIGKEEVHRRHFFHLPLLGSAPERWRHCECNSADSGPAEIELELYWVFLSEAAARLVHGHGALLDLLAMTLPNQRLPRT